MSWVFALLLDHALLQRIHHMKDVNWWITCWYLETRLLTFKGAQMTVADVLLCWCCVCVCVCEGVGLAAGWIGSQANSIQDSQLGYVAVGQVQFVNGSQGQWVVWTYMHQWVDVLITALYCSEWWEKIIKPVSDMNTKSLFERSVFMLVCVYSWDCKTNNSETKNTSFLELFLISNKIMRKCHALFFFFGTQW